MKNYEETNSVDINLLDEGNWLQEYCTQGDNTRSCEEYATRVSRDVFEAFRYLSELQEVVEDVCARLMGSSCALQ